MKQSNITNWERHNEIGILSISNGKENYLEFPDFLNLEQLKEWTSEKDLKGIVIRGIGRNFSAGANIENLKQLSKDQQLLKWKIKEGKEILDFIEDLNIPVIAAINGVCFGGGLEIALACHMRIATGRALFAFPEANHGLIPGLGGTYRLVHLVGKKTYEMILKGDMINAVEAEKDGLVNYLSESKDSFQFAVEKLTNMIQDRPIEVINSVMQAIKNGTKMNREEALRVETELFCKLAIHVEHHKHE